MAAPDATYSVTRRTKRLLVLQIQGIVKKEQVLELVQTIQEAIGEQTEQSILLDTQGNSPDGVATVRRAAEALGTLRGVRRFAMFGARGAKGLVMSMLIRFASNLPYTLKSFNSESEALRWLESD